VRWRLLVKVESNIGRCGMESGTSKARENRKRTKGSLNEPIYCTDVARTEARLARGRPVATSATWSSGLFVF